jgi:hypothetical protein
LKIENQPAARARSETGRIVKNWKLAKVDVQFWISWQLPILAIRRYDVSP